jgi:hypothetical protein
VNEPVAADFYLTPDGLIEGQDDDLTKALEHRNWVTGKGAADSE